MTEVQTLLDSPEISRAAPRLKFARYLVLHALTVFLAAGTLKLPRELRRELYEINSQSLAHQNRLHEIETTLPEFILAYVALWLPKAGGQSCLRQPLGNPLLPQELAKYIVGPGEFRFRHVAKDRRLARNNPNWDNPRCFL